MNFSIEEHPGLNDSSLFDDMFKQIKHKQKESESEIETLNSTKFYKNNWLEHIFKIFLEAIGTHYILSYPDDPNHRGSTPVDFSLMGQTNYIIECKYSAFDSQYFLNRVTKQQYYQLQWSERIENIRAYILIAWGTYESHIMFLIPWARYKAVFHLHAGGKLDYNEFYEEFKNFEIDISNPVYKQNLLRYYVHS